MKLLKIQHTEAQAIENIDIGGVSLIRAAAKNVKFVNVLTNPNQYNEWINSSSNIFYRKQLAKKIISLKHLLIMILK